MRMKLFLKVLKVLNAILAKFNLPPIELEKLYAEETRKDFLKLYEEGRIDWMPEKITCRIDEESGEVFIYIEPLPPYIRVQPTKDDDEKFCH